MITGLILCAIAYILVELVWGNRRDKEITESLPKGNFLFVDIETLGEVDELDFLSNNSTGFPAIGQICWILIDPKGKELFRRNLFSTDAPDSFLKKSENY
nr:hypothetical protein [Cryomorphaceae bacterium]